MFECHRLIPRAVALSVLIVASGCIRFAAPIKLQPSRQPMTFEDPDGRFSVGTPTGWQILSGVGGVVVSFEEKGRHARIVIERSTMNTSLAPEDITDLFVQLEVDKLKERQPKAAVMTSKRDSGHVIVIDYERPGVVGPERVRRSSRPVGSNLFRLSCIATPEAFAKYAAACSSAADSFVAKSADAANVGRAAAVRPPLASAPEASEGR